MQTIKVISNISYNTHDYFEKVVNNLFDRGIIDFCYWIHHEPDLDELKPHTHFVLKPSKRVDTMELRKAFNEFDPTNPKPLTCTTRWFTTNSMEDWLLYVVHDEMYLASKGQRRNIRYEFTDLQATDEDALRIDWNSIDRTKFDRLRILYEAVENHVPFVTLVQMGAIPMAQRAQWQFQYNDLAVHLASEKSNRKVSHECDEDGVIQEDADVDTAKQSVSVGVLGEFLEDEELDF